MASLAALADRVEVDREIDSSRNNDRGGASDVDELESELHAT